MEGKVSNLVEKSDIPEAAVWPGMVSMQHVAMLILSERDPVMAELCSIFLKGTS